MKRLLLLNPPGTKKYFRDYYCSCVSKGKYYYHPVDLLYLSGRLYKKYLISVIDAIAEDISPKETIFRIKKIMPNCIIFLISSPSYDEDVVFLSKLKKEFSNAKFIGTGDVYRDLKERAFKLHNFLDAILLDFSTDDILKYLTEEKSGNIFSNIIYKKDKRIVKGDEKHGYGIFNIPIPRWELFPIQKYSFPFSKKGKYATVLTDFGCPFSCSFCPVSTLGFKLRDIETVIKELKVLKRLGISEIFFRDQTFGVNKKRTFELCNRIIKEKLNISWTCFSRVDIVDENLLRKIKQAGCHTIMFGIETLNEHLLKEYKKNIKIKQIIDALAISKKVGLRTVGTFLIGLPGETKESIETTINFAKKLDIEYASFNIATPRFGTSIRKDLIKKGMVNEKAMIMDSAKSKPTWQNIGISNEEIFNLQRKAVRSFYLRPSYLIKRLTKIRTFYEFKEHINEALSFLIDSR